MFTISQLWPGRWWNTMHAEQNKGCSNDKLFSVVRLQSWLSPSGSWLTRRAASSSSTMVWSLSWFTFSTAPLQYPGGSFGIKTADFFCWVIGSIEVVTLWPRLLVSGSPKSWKGKASSWFAMITWYTPKITYLESSDTNHYTLKKEKEKRIRRAETMSLSLRLCPMSKI